MRRKDKEVVDRERIDEIIRGAQVCRLAMIDGDEPYLVPLSFGYDGRAIYFHSAVEGRKVEALRRNARVCFEIDTGVEVLEGGTVNRLAIVLQPAICPEQNCIHVTPIFL